MDSEKLEELVDILYNELKKHRLYENLVHDLENITAKVIKKWRKNRGK